MIADKVLFYGYLHPYHHNVRVIFAHDSGNLSHVFFTQLGIPKHLFRLHFWKKKLVGACDAFIMLWITM